MRQKEFRYIPGKRRVKLIRMFEKRCIQLRSKKTHNCIPFARNNVLPTAPSGSEDGLNIPNARAVKRYRSLSPSLSGLFPMPTDFRINGSPAKQIRHLLLAEEDCIGGGDVTGQTDVCDQRPDRLLMSLRVKRAHVCSDITAFFCFPLIITPPLVAFLCLQDACHHCQSISVIGL